VSDLRGTWFVVPTPFTEDGAVDLPGLRRVVEGAIAWGVNGVTVMGLTSEAAELSAPEREFGLEAIAATVAGRVPVVVGCSDPDPAVVRERATRAAARGAAAAMVAALPGADPAELPAYYRGVAEESGLPLVVQDEPAATGVRMDDPILLACLTASNSTAVKLEDPPTAPKVGRLMAARPDLDVFGGLGGASALWELRRGACGTMSGFAFPEVLAAVRRHTEAGDHGAAGAVFDRFLPLILYEFQLGLGVRKELLRRRGVLSTSATRRPVVLDAGTLADLDDVLERIGVKPGPERMEVT
jgi:4-hydroxy-tetrahydrodipicolinate synthase